MTLDMALYLLRQTQIVRMQIGDDPELDGVLTKLEMLARKNVVAQRAAQDWLETNRDQLFKV